MHNQAQITLTLLIALVLSNMTHANDLDTAAKHLQSRDFDKAFPILKHLAEQGDPISQHNMGTLYFKGDGVAQNFEKAIYWYEKSAKSGHKHQAVVNSMYQLALLFRGYKTHPRDEKKFVYWLEQAANAGDLVAMNQMGILYYGGQVVTKDYAKSFHWFSRAAKQNHPEAQSFLGDLYRFGRSVKQDYAESALWYTKAAAQNYPHALFMLGAYHGQGLGVPQDRAKSISYYEKAAKIGHPEAIKMLASRRVPALTIVGQSRDPEYGYTAGKAIRTGGPGGSRQRAYLEKLRGPEGQTIQYRRTGSCAAYKDESQAFGQALIDCYHLSYQGQAKPVTLFLDLYRSETLLAPHGFTFVK